MKSIQPIGVWQHSDNQSQYHHMYLSAHSWVEIRPSGSESKWQAVLYVNGSFCESISGDSLNDLKNLIGKWQQLTWKFVGDRMIQYKSGVDPDPGGVAFPTRTSKGYL